MIDLTKQFEKALQYEDVFNSFGNITCFKAVPILNTIAQQAIKEHCIGIAEWMLTNKITPAIVNNGPVKHFKNGTFYTSKELFDAYLKTLENKNKQG